MSESVPHPIKHHSKTDSLFGEVSQYHVAPAVKLGKNIQIKAAANELVFTWSQKINTTYIKTSSLWIMYGGTSGAMGGVFVVSTHTHSVVMIGQDVQQPGFRKNSDVLQLLQMLPWDMNTHKQHNSKIALGSKLKAATLLTYASAFLLFLKQCTFSSNKLLLPTSIVWLLKE